MEQREREEFNIFPLDNVKLSVAHLKKKPEKEAREGVGKQPRELPPQGWEVKERGTWHTLEIRGTV